MVRMSFRAIAVTLVAAASLAQLSSAQPQAGQGTKHKLTADDLRSLMSVPFTSYSVGNYGPKTNAAYFTPDGNIKFKSPNQNDTGKYRVTDDGKLCTQYKVLRNGTENCQDLYQTGPDQYESHLPNGTIVTSQWVPGNPENF